jgi:hypothetical protein
MANESTKTNICPKCGAELENNETTCPNCGNLIKNEENTDNDSTVVIRTFSSEFEAEIAQGILKEEGIESFISKDDEGSMNPALQLTVGVKLHIFEKDVKRVTEILDSVNTNFDLSDSDSDQSEPDDDEK